MNPSLSVAKLRIVKAYQVEIDGVARGLFLQESEWQGMSKLVDAEGRTLIIDLPRGNTGAMDRILAELLDKPIEVDIVRASPSLFAPVAPKESPR